MSCSGLLLASELSSAHAHSIVLLFCRFTSLSTAKRDTPPKKLAPAATRNATTNPPVESTKNPEQEKENMSNNLNKSCLTIVKVQTQSHNNIKKII